MTSKREDGIPSEEPRLPGVVGKAYTRSRGPEADSSVSSAPRSRRRWWEKGPAAVLVASLVGVKSVVYAIVPPGGVLSAAFNMASTCIGAGILGLPAAADSCGLVMAMIYLAVISTLTIFSMHIIVITTERTKIRSYDGMSKWLFPRWNYAFSYFAAFIRCLQGFAGGVAYVISIGNCYHPIFTGALERHPDNKHLKFLASKSGNRLLTAMTWLAIMVPLVIPKHIDSLRYASAVAVVFMCYFVLIVIIHSGMNGLPEHRGNVITVGHPNDPEVSTGPFVFLFRTGNTVVESVGVFAFVLGPQISCFDSLADMSPALRDTRHFTYASVLAVAICFTLYALVCTFVYFDFGSEVLRSNSILLLYKPLDEPQMMIAYIGVLFKVSVSYAIMTLVARNSLYYFIGWQHRFRRPADTTVTIDADDNDDNDASSTVMPDEKPQVVATADAYDGDFEPLDDGITPPEPDNEDACRKSGDDPTTAKPSAKTARAPPVPDPFFGNANDKRALQLLALSTAEDSSYLDNIPFWMHTTAVMVIATISMLAGLFIPKINMVLGFAGAICGGCIGFIFPALFYLYSAEVSRPKYSSAVSYYFYLISTLLLLIAGVIAVVWGTAGTIYSTVPS